MIALEQGQYESEGFRLALDFAVAPRSFVAVLGPSGAGKSTLLNIIAGFEGLVSGRVVLGGQDMTTTPPAARPVSLVFQDHNSFAHLDARDNVALGISPALKLDAAQWQRVDNALTRVGLSHLALRKPGDMSGGERQRIALARVLVRKQPILLLDEAFAALGPALRRDMLSLVKALAGEQNLTVLMVTHQPEDARLVADHVMFVDAGVVRKPISVGAFFDADGDEAIQTYLGEVQ